MIAIRYPCLPGGRGLERGNAAGGESLPGPSLPRAVSAFGQGQTRTARNAPGAPGALRIPCRITDHFLICALRRVRLPLLAADASRWHTSVDVRQDSDLRFAGESDPIASAVSVRRRRLQHTLRNIPVHRGEWKNHLREPPCMNRIPKPSSHITEKKVRAQASPHFFCISRRFFIRSAKLSGSVTRTKGPKDSTRITISVSSSC